MFRVSIALLLALFLAVPVGAAEVDSDSVYCFSDSDFSQEPLAGICITGLPDPQTGTVMLGSRVLQKGDILAADQIAQMTFLPLPTQEDTVAQVSYLPIYENRVEKNCVMTISIRGKTDEVPVAEDSSVETYKNLPNEGKVKASDPEGKELTYTLIHQPKRGQVELRQDGTFTYTPRNNKVGVDSFTFTATDPAGNVSREATVTVQILKPTDSRQYTDTVGKPCRFAAEWMRNSGLFVGEQVGGENCFFPEKEVSRGEFLAMVTKLLQIPQGDPASISSDAPGWLKPYLAAAVRSGLVAGLPQETFAYEEPITAEEAAVILQNALDLSISHGAMETMSQEDVPQWAAASLCAMTEHGVDLTAGQTLTRGQVAEVLYRVSYLSITAPGMQVLRLQQ